MRSMLKKGWYCFISLASVMRASASVSVLMKEISLMEETSFLSRGDANPPCLK